YIFNDNNIARVRFYIPSIHCASCIWLLENLRRLNSGIRHSSVNFMRKEIIISFNTGEISLRKVVELLASVHYTPDISLHTIDNRLEEPVNKKLLYRIGVAGFVFGNVMLYSLPRYFNGEPIEEPLGTFLGWLSYFLTLPLVFYSGYDYLVSAFKNLVKGMINIDLPIALGIVVLFGVTSYEVISGSGPGYSDSLSGFLFFLLLGRWYQAKTYQALSFDRDYKSYFPVSVTKISGDGEQNILLDEITKGDILLIRNRELIPCDSELLTGRALIDYSFVTGESEMVQKEVGEPLYAGGIQHGGAITVEVKKVIDQSHLTQLWNQSGDVSPNERSVSSIIDRVSLYFTLTVIAIAFSGFGFWMFRGTMESAILVFTSVLIVACPCALALSLPFTFGNVMRSLGMEGMYIKNLLVIEKLTRADTIVFDKTGTITVPDRNDIRYTGKELSAEETRYIFSLTRQSTHPYSNALAQKFNKVEPFNTSGYVEVAGRGIFALINNRRVKLGSAEYAAPGFKSDSDGRSSVFLSVDEEVKGYFTIGNSYRNGFAEVTEKLVKRYELFILSGDNDSERSYLEGFLDPGKIFFNQLPQDKKEFISRLQSDKKNVIMLGDGLNDAGAFMKSDVALSIADDIYHFTPAGDAIIEASKFHKLPAYIDFSRRSVGILKASFIISLLYNIAGLSFALSGNLTPVVAAILMPASSVSVVVFATFSTRILANLVLKGNRR
ncbi:MAG: HAD family hydrolase, partial [Bacteroidia bacterium]